MLLEKAFKSKKAGLRCSWWYEYYGMQLNIYGLGTVGLGVLIQLTEGEQGDVGLQYEYNPTNEVYYNVINQRPIFPFAQRWRWSNGFTRWGRVQGTRNRDQ